MTDARGHKVQMEGQRGCCRGVRSEEKQQRWQADQMVRGLEDFLLFSRDPHLIWGLDIGTEGFALLPRDWLKSLKGFGCSTTQQTSLSRTPREIRGMAEKDEEDVKDRKEEKQSLMGKRF